MMSDGMDRVWIGRGTGSGSGPSAASVWLAVTANTAASSAMAHRSWSRVVRTSSAAPVMASSWAGVSRSMNSSRTAATWRAAAASILSRPRGVMATKVPRRSASQGTFLTRFNEFDGRGYLTADNAANSWMQLTIKAASIDTRNADRDAHLRSNDFFDMDTYPEISFASTGVEQVDDDTFVVTGDLTIKGVTKPVAVGFDSAAQPSTRGATRASVSRARPRSTARTGASTGMPPSTQAAFSSARR